MSDTPCPNCGAPLRGDVGFCTSCGAKTDAMTDPDATAVRPPDTCPTCGRPVDPYDRFCRECGTPSPRPDGADDATRPMDPLAGAAAAGPLGQAPPPNHRGMWAMIAIAVLVIAGGVTALVLALGGDDNGGARTDTGSRTETGAQTDTGSQTDFTVPSIPDFTVPSIPDFTVPDFTVPSIPDFTAPDFTVPDFTVPDFTVPSIPDFGSQIPSAPGRSGDSSSRGRTVQLAPLARSRSADCGQPGYVVMSGRRHETNFIQCGSNTGNRASGSTEVDLSSVPSLASDARLESFSALVGIDEASDAAVTSASFRVSYGTKIICSVEVRRNAPGRCEADGLDLRVQPGLPLEMKQDVRANEPTKTLFAAFLEPEVTFR